MEHSDRIDKLFFQIISGVSGGTMFGIPVDVTNVKSLVVAAFLMGKSEQVIISEKQRAKDLV